MSARLILEMEAEVARCRTLAAGYRMGGLLTLTSSAAQAAGALHHAVTSLKELETARGEHDPATAD